MDRAALRMLPFEWCGDFLFASISPAHSLSEQLNGVADLVIAISRSVSGRVDLNCLSYECDWKVAIENALEPCHIDLVHSATLGTLRLSEGRNELFRYASTWYAEVGDKRTSSMLRSMGRFFDLEFQYDGYMSLFLYPFSMISATYGYSYSVQNFFPTDEPYRTAFSSRLMSGRLRTGVPESLTRSFFESSSTFNRRVFDEDHEICRRVDRAFWSDERFMPLSANEVKVAHFRERYFLDLENQERAPGRCGGPRG